MIALALGLAYAHPGVDDRLVETETCDVGPLLSLARAYADERRPADASRTLDRAAACGADPSVVAEHRALVDGSIEALDAAIAADPDHAGLRLTRSHVLATLGRTSDAIADAERALARIERPQPDDALFLSRLHAGDPVRALAVLDDTIRRIGPAPALVDEALTLERSLGWTIAALARLDGLPRTPFWLDRRAEILLRSGATAEAADVWREALMLTEARPTPANRARAETLQTLLAAW